MRELRGIFRHTGDRHFGKGHGGNKDRSLKAGGRRLYYEAFDLGEVEARVLSKFKAAEFFQSQRTDTSV